MCNLQRIRHLPQDTRLREIYDNKTWHEKPFVFYEYEEAEKYIRARRRLTDVTEDELIDATTGKPNDKRKRTIKEVNRKAEKAEVTHFLRKTHEELLERFTQHSYTSYVEAKLTTYGALYEVASWSNQRTYR